ncbi:MAG TPA: hypothetical protein PLC53_03420 [Bacilli bacterium]|nr:hypothetical protein [Bacilli bacterium]
MKIKDIVKLSDGIEYIVASKVENEGDTYYYFIGKDDYSKIKFLKDKDNTLENVTSPEIIKSLLPEFIREATDSLTPEDLQIIEQANDNE